MRRAILFTAYDRPNLLERVLGTWQNVRGIQEWDLYFSIDPSAVTPHVVRAIEAFSRVVRNETVMISVNTRKLGVLLHPYEGFEHLFSRGYEYVLRAEDDLLVSDDVLEYHSWAATEFFNRPKVLCVTSVADAEHANAREVTLSPGFSPWIWGTWRNRWVEVLGPTWDKDYSTFNEFAGHQSGWDWNINTRIMPEYDYRAAAPMRTRVQNVGYFGTHAQGDFTRLAGFDEHIEPQDYTEV